MQFPRPPRAIYDTQDQRHAIQIDIGLLHTAGVEAQDEIA